jgi:hypothetical protein
VTENLTFPELIAFSSTDGPGGSEYTERAIVKALMATHGLVTHAAAHRRQRRPLLHLQLQHPRLVRPQR